MGGGRRKANEAESGQRRKAAPRRARVTPTFQTIPCLCGSDGVAHQDEWGGDRERWRRGGERWRSEVKEVEETDGKMECDEEF